MTDASGLLNIGSFSLITRLSPKALRFYDDKGLLVPAKEEITGYRMYSYQQIRQGMLLKRLADLGFGVEDMRTILEVIEGCADRSALETVVAGRIQEVRSQVQELEKVRGELERKTFEEVIDMQQEVIIKEVPPLRVVSRREKGTYSETIPRLIKEICTMMFAQAPQARMCGPPMVIYHDQEYKENDADIEVAIPVSGRVTVDAGYELKSLPAVKVVSTIHRGPFQQVGEAWGRAFKYIGENDHKPAGPGREVYLSDPANTSQEELLTEVQVPIL